MQHVSKHKDKKSLYEAWIRRKSCRECSFCAQTETTKRLLLLLSGWSVIFTAH